MTYEVAVDGPRTVPPRRTPPSRHRGRDALMPLADAGLLGTVGVLAATLMATPWPLAAGYPITVLALCAGTGQYRPRLSLRIGDQLPRLVCCAGLPAVLLAPGDGVTAALTAGVAATLVTGGRALTLALVRAARRRGLVEPVILVGAGALGARIATTLIERPEYGLAPYGFLDERRHTGTPRLPSFGPVAALPQVLAAHRIRRVIVCFPHCTDEVLVRVLRALRPTSVRVYVVPRLHELAVPVAGRDEIRDVPLLPMPYRGRAGRLGKRAFDLVVAAVLLVALAPLLAVLAVAVRRSTGGPALFRQVRLSRSGRAITILKLRSMAPDPDADTRWEVPPERCTRLGALLRATHLDELPQLFNVLRGDMSLVGPRPERPYFAARFTATVPRYADRHRVPAGMTGWAQVHGLHGDTSITDRVRFDNRYIEDWSGWLDLRILARTVAQIVPRRSS